jgi:putative spermidine/putrescine transport system permease protein
VVSAVDEHRAGPLRRVSALLFRHPRLKLAVTLGPPLTWVVVVYLAAIGFMLLTSLWHVDPLTSETVKEIGFQNYRTVYVEHTYRAIALRTLGVAVAVTITDLVFAFPLAYHMARLAKPRIRVALMLAITIPLWINYLVKLSGWKTVLAGGGPAEAFLSLFGIHTNLVGTNIAVWITLCYIWFPFTVLPIYASLERVPESMLEASGDLGARGWFTFRKVLFPLVLPGVAAASLFAFSLSLGDYITATFLGNKLFIGNAIDQLVGIANNRPLAAAIATMPIVIMAVYMAIVRKLGAFEAL